MMQINGERNNMNNSEYVSLTGMGSGSKGMIVQIEGGHGLISRLNALGIRPNKKITKISSMVMRGPVTIDIDGTQVALGFGMAKRIIVQPDGSPK
jgi:ferrous iron transport protein A